MKPKSLDNKKLINSFKYAFNGIKLTILNEQNMFIHTIIACLVIICAFIFKISRIEFIICLILIGIVFMMELLNTAIENICDLITKEENENIKSIKDISAGSVLVIAFISFIIGLIIFIPRILEVLK